MAPEALQLAPPSVQSKIDAFKASITPDLHSTKSFVDWERISSTLDALSPGITVLKRLARRKSRLTASGLGAAILEEPIVYAVLLRLFAITGAIGFEDGRHLPSPHQPPNTSVDCKLVAQIFLDLGLQKLIAAGHALDYLVLISQIGAEPLRRRFKVAEKLRSIVDEVVSVAIAQATKSVDAQISLTGDRSLTIGGRFPDYVIAVDAIPKLAIAMTFQARSGGRQQRDLTHIYPNYRNELFERGLSLILIADGLGFKEMPDHVLETLLTSIPDCMTLKQARAGALLEAIKEGASSTKDTRTVRTPLETIIRSTLDSEEAVLATSLPGSLDRTKLALARYYESHPDLALSLDPEGTGLRWTRANTIGAISALTKAFEERQAVHVFAELLAADVSFFEDTDAPLRAELLLPVDRILPRHMQVACAGFGTRLIRDLAKQSLHDLPDSKLAVLLTREIATDEQIEYLRKIQPQLPVNIIVVTLESLKRLAQAATPPRDAFVSLVLEQSDLRKASPFVVRGVAPERIFYGREGEEATMLSTLATNSIALLGARRIGKTSLMVHATRALQEAEFQPFFGDCQTVRTWSDFGNMAARTWNVELPEQFKPHHLFDLVNRLHVHRDRKVVILLDEIDQLLDWDIMHPEDRVPEAFFRACRSISQQALAQFVFSGERTIAGRIWDAHSPHWNFCSPLSLQQLERSSAEDLITQPLKSLQISIEDESEFGHQSWVRTSGHPELIQFLGDKLVRQVGERSMHNALLTVDDIISVTEQYEFAEQYLETYWGQATELERLVSLLVEQDDVRPADVAEMLRSKGVHLDPQKAVDALRILELYGIVQSTEGGYRLKAEWFPQALAFYGGKELVSTRLLERVR